MSRRKLLVDWGGYAGSQYAARLSTMIRGFIVARLLGPTEYGKWVALLLIYQLGSYVHLGILSGMAREIPFHLGKDEEETADEYRDCGFTAVAGLTALFCVVLLAVDLFAWSGYTALTRFALPAAGIAVFLQNMTFTYHNIFRARDRIGPISKSWTIQGISNLALSIPLVIYWGVYGLFAALLASNLMTVLFLRSQADWRFRFLPRRDRMARLLVRGLPVMAYLFVGVLLAQVDKIVIVRLLSRESLGIYGIASTVSGMLRYITTSASFILFPRYLSKFGKTGEISSLSRNVREPTFAFSIFIPVFLALVYIWIHVPVAHVLPRYLPGVDAMRILVCGTVFFSLASLASYFLITVNRTKPLLVGGAAIVAVEYVLNSYLVMKGYGINGVAFGAAICQFLYGTILLVVAFRLIPDGRRSVARSLLETYLPTFYVAAIVALLIRIFPFNEVRFEDEVRMGLLRGGILIAAVSPLFVLLQKKTGVFSLVADILRRNPDN